MTAEERVRFSDVTIDVVWEPACRDDCHFARLLQRPRSRWIGPPVGARTDAPASYRPPYIRNTPNFVSGTGALSAAEKASARTRRVSPGRMMPSSQSRAVA